MSDVAINEESTRPTPTREDIEHRVEDWIGRLENLFTQVRAWGTAKGWKVDQSGVMPMHEDLMKRYGLPPRDQPTLFMTSHRGHFIMKPKALWVIGANGRVDLYTTRDAYIVVDRAERFQTPEWTLYDPTRRSGEGFPFSEAILDDVA